ncbi:MAG: zf-HC2 domain-containing protein [Melioribacteraceae bacterium]|nr:zf-HC2 domain-containing protein [Melioribacteraceae bacterium]
MNCEEVKINLNDYVDEELDEFTRRELEYHVRNCDACIKEYKKLMLFFDKLKDIPISVNPPNDLIDRIKDELLKESGVKDKDELNISKAHTKKILKERKRQTQHLTKTNPVVKKSKVTKKLVKKKLNIDARSGSKKVLKIILPIIILILGYIIYEQSRINHPWQISSIEGVTKIDNEIINNGNWFQGSKLKTENNSKAKILVPAVGVVYVESNSFIELVTAKKGNNEIKINYGKLRILNTEFIPSLKFNIHNLEVVNRAGEFIVSVDIQQNVEISVLSGFVELIHNNKSYLVDKKYYCRIQRGMIPGLPIRVDASDSLKLAVDFFEFKNSEEKAVEKIINNAKQNDMLTLLALIPRVNQLQRQIIFQIISNYYPPPETITRAGIIRLDEEMLYRWWEEIEWQI